MQTHRNVQVVLESHSEHLLLRLQRRIAEAIPQGVTSNDVSLYFCDWKDGKSKIEKLEVDMFGAIVNWPEHFMGDTFGEVSKAEMKRIERRRNLSE